MKALSKRPNSILIEQTGSNGLRLHKKYIMIFSLLGITSLATFATCVNTVAYANDRKPPIDTEQSPNNQAGEVTSLAFPSIGQPGGSSTNIAKDRYAANFIGSMASSSAVAPRPRLVSIPKLSNPINGKFFANLGTNKQRAQLTPNLGLQNEVQLIVNSIRAPHVAIVALDPKTGKVLAIAGKSVSIPDITTHNLFPAASLFKIVTAAASFYTNDTNANSIVNFRGGNYALNKYNYLPNVRADKRKMTVGEAMGKSCNPVFGRLALNLPSSAVLRDFALMLQFGTPIQADFTIPQSDVFIPNDAFNLSKTGAGFGQVTISPIHAAALVAAIANKGLFPVPQIIEKIVDAEGNSLPIAVRPPKQIIDADIASSLVEMMKYTTKIGTARNPFASTKKNPGLPFEVAGKTGTLQGKAPKGLTKWFIAAAPASNPQIAIAAVVVNPQNGREVPTYLGRKILDYFFAKKDRS